MSIDLQDFCATIHDPRKELRQPWGHKGYRWATNGHLLVRLTAPEHEAASELKVATKAEQIMEKAPRDGYAALPAFSLGTKCVMCNGAGTVKEVKCDECDGEGEFTHGTHDYLCKECDGTGWADEPGGEARTCRSCNGLRTYAECVEFKSGVGYDARYLAMLRKLPGILFAAGAPEQPGFFRFDGGDGALMPMRLMR